MSLEALSETIRVWKTNPNFSYLGWFLSDDRTKNFRSIRRGIKKVIEEIEQGKFGNAYRGSSLETVVYSIAEQKRIFKGADHAFLWKPKLRIPDIYENEANQRAFGRFLGACLECCGPERIIEEIHDLDRRKIKGLGPAAANLLYFLHPTLVPPFNTAIVKGFNKLTGSSVKLGRWDQYLAMREGVLRFNDQHRDWLSNDLGAVAGFLFDVGSDLLSPSLRRSSENEWALDLENVRAQAAGRTVVDSQFAKDQISHSEIQRTLRDLGRELGFNVWIAINDRNRLLGEGKLGDGCIGELQIADCESSSLDSIQFIDVLWLDPNSKRIVAAFEVEHSTSIYSGILRMLDLALGPHGEALKGIYLVAPDKRESDVRAQIARPAFQALGRLDVKYLPYGELLKNREAMGRFGQGLKAIEAVAKSLRS